MAIVRTKEFVINLGDVVKTRLEGFVNMTKNIRARGEADFQRRIIDNDLSYDEQLEYRKKQLAEEQKKSFPDNEFITEIKKEISGLGKLSRQRKFRDGYFNFLQEMSEGKKSLEDHLTYLKNEVEYGGLDKESKDALQDKILSIKGEITTSNRKIFDSQIAFWETDKTADSLGRAISSVRSEMNKLEVQKTPELLNAYQLKLQNLEKSLREVGVEDKMNNLYINLLKSKSDYPSVDKINNFRNFIDSASTLPITVVGVRYTEKEYWETVSNNYIKNNFSKEFSQEINNKYSGIYNQLGQLPNTYLSEFKSQLNGLKNNSSINIFPNVVLDAVQGASAAIINLKAKEITLKYGLDKDFIGVSDYNKATQDYKSLQTYFGADFSMTPDVLSLENRLAEYKYKLAGSLQEKAQQAVDAGQYANIEQAIKALGPLTEVEVAKEVYIGKSITDIALEEQRKTKEVIEKAPVSPPIKEEKPPTEEVKPPVEPTKAPEVPKVEEKPVVPPTPPPVVPKTVAVQAGETLSAIALRELGSAARWKELKTPEGIGFTEETAKKLQIGQKLIIPTK